MDSSPLTDLHPGYNPATRYVRSLPAERVRMMPQPTSSITGGTRTEHLAKWAAALQFSDIPDDAVQRTKDLFLDWLGCAVAGRHHPAVSAIARFAAQMGPSTGKCELVDGSLNLTTSPALASLVNGASSHVVEQDDLHMSSITHPVSAVHGHVQRGDH